MCKVLENRSQQDEERMDQLTNQLKEARLLAEDADGKSDEVSRKLAFVEDELEVAEDRVKSGEAKIMELEEELKVCILCLRWKRQLENGRICLIPFATLYIFFYFLIRSLETRSNHWKYRKRRLTKE